MSASRYINKLRNLAYALKANPEMARKTILAKISEEDAKELETMEPEGMVKDEMLHEASKVVTAAAFVEACFKSLSIIDSYNKEGFEMAEEKFKSHLGVSGYDTSEDDIQKMLEQILKNLKETEVEIGKLSSNNVQDFSDEE